MGLCGAGVLEFVEDLTAKLSRTEVRCISAKAGFSQASLSSFGTVRQTRAM
jgi:hypothetical protein